jgi:hypothetical protein
MKRGSLLLVVLMMAASVAQAAPPDTPKVIRLAPQSTAKHAGALHYRLLPGPLDRTSGNAAPLWRLAGDAYRGASHNMTLKQFDWSGLTPLKDLPREEMRELLGHYRAALRLARQAACRDHCDWEMPPLTLQSVQEYLPLEMPQRCRELANLLGIQYRLQLVEGRFDDAIETLQTGFALARDVGMGDRVIDHLVGIAIAAIMFGHVEEWIETPRSPNLYWALTTLPPSFLDVRRSVEQEVNTLYRSFPRLRRLRRETWTAQQVEALAKEIFDLQSKVMGDANPKQAEQFAKLGESIQKAEHYPQARQHLLDLGRTAREIDAMPRVQVVLLWYLARYDRVRDEVLKALALPAWQGSSLMEQAMKEVSAADDPSLSLLMPALSKTYAAQLRYARQLASLRGAEALRLYAAAHEGKPPVKWSDITGTPLPIDPVTGKGFDAMYQVKDGRGVLEVPSPPPTEKVASLRRRFELAPSR